MISLRDRLPNGGSVRQGLDEPSGPLSLRRRLGSGLALWTPPSGTRTAIALSGGGAKGSFEIGALHLLGALWPQLGVVRITGTSVGAINAVALAEDGGARTVRRMLDVWLALRRPEDMFRPSPWLAELDDESRKAIQTGVVHGGLLVAAPMIGLVAALMKLKDLVDDVDAAREGESLYRLEPTRERFVEAVDWEALRNSDIDLRLVAVDQVTGRPVALTKDLLALRPRATGSLSFPFEGVEARELVPLDPDRDDWRQVIEDAVFASAAIPGVFPAVRLGIREADGEVHEAALVDGGVTDTLPVAATGPLLDEDESVNVVLGISASPIDVNQFDRRWGDSRFVRQAAWHEHAERGLSAALSELHRRDLDEVPDGAELLHVAPGRLVHGTMEIDAALIRINAAYGYMRCYDELAARAGASDEDVASLRQGSHAVAEARVAALRYQRRVRIESGAEARVSFAAGDLRRLRNRKARVGEVVVERVERFGLSSVPVDLDPERPVLSWWTDWEMQGVGAPPPTRYLDRQISRTGGDELVIHEPEPDEVYVRRLVDMPEWIHDALS